MSCEVYHPVMWTVAQGAKKEERKKKKKNAPHSTPPEIMQRDGLQIAGALKKKKAAASVPDRIWPPRLSWSSGRISRLSAADEEFLKQDTFSHGLFL